MYPEEPNSNNHNADGGTDNPNALAVSISLRPPPPYSRPPPYARPPPPYSRPSSEALLFDDLFREKAITLRSIMADFLLVQPFYKFEAEFQTFLTRIKRLTAQGQRAVAAAAAVRDANAAAASASAAASNNMTEDTAHSAVASASGSGQPPPPPYGLGLRSSNDNEQRPSVDQPGTSASACSSANTVALTTPFLDGDTANIGSGSRANRPKSSRSGSSMTEIHEKYLSKWSVDITTLDLVCPIAILKLNGTLLAADKVTVIEETHDAGLIECRKGSNLIKTSQGLYHLCGSIAGAFSNDFHRACLENNDFPKNWKHFLLDLTNVEETSEDDTNSDDNSMTRNGTNYKNGAQKSNEKGKLTKQNLAKQKAAMQQLSQVSAHKSMEQYNVCKTPSQFLKYQFHRKLVKACKIVSNQFK